MATLSSLTEISFNSFRKGKSAGLFREFEKLANSGSFTADPQTAAGTSHVTRLLQLFAILCVAFVRIVCHV